MSATAYYTLPLLQPQPLSLNLSPSHALSLEFSADIHYSDQANAAESSQGGKWTLHMRLLAAPRIHLGEHWENGVIYRLRVDDFELKDSSDRLVISFTRKDQGNEEEGGALYRSDSRWTAEERAEIFRTILLDLTHHDREQDESLFQQWAELLLYPEGRLGELSFSPRLRSFLLNETSNLRLAPLIHSFIQAPESLPPLFPQTLSIPQSFQKFPPEQWVTDGSRTGSSSTIWRHQIIEKGAPSTPFYLVKTLPSPMDEGSLSQPEPRGNWQFTWNYDLVNKIVTEIKGEWSYSQTERLLGVPSRIHCQLNWQLNVKNIFNFDTSTIPK